jgi:hypothetical protein
MTSGYPDDHATSRLAMIFLPVYLRETGDVSVMYFGRSVVGPYPHHLYRNLQDNADLLQARGLSSTGCPNNAIAGRPSSWHAEHIAPIAGKQVQEQRSPTLHISNIAMTQARSEYRQRTMNFHVRDLYSPIPLPGN